MKQKQVDFANIEVNILVRPENKVYIKRLIEQLALWGAIGVYEKKDIIKRIDEVG